MRQSQYESILSAKNMKWLNPKPVLSLPDLHTQREKMIYLRLIVQLEDAKGKIVKKGFFFLHKNWKSFEKDPKKSQCFFLSTSIFFWRVVRLHCGPEQPKIQTEELGHSPVRSLFRSHRSLVCLLRPTRFAHVLRCAHFSHFLAGGTVNY